jgi:hypothetical protein
MHKTHFLGLKMEYLITLEDSIAHFLGIYRLTAHADHRNIRTG